MKSQYHLFRYASEWDPREKGKTKGGYLEAEIHLPQVTKGLKVVISTFPTSIPEDISSKVQEIHPTLLHVVRKTKTRRMNELEPVPNIHHWKQEFLIVDNKVVLVNRVSSLDNLRNVPVLDELFHLNNECVLTFGKGVGELNMIILIPKTDARANGKDVTLQDLLRGRIQDESIVAKMEQHYKGKNSVNLKQIKLKVEFFELSHEGISCAVGFSSVISETISDTVSKQLGTLDFYDATPLKSCQTGGRKVIMVSEFGLAGDVEPRFQLWDCNGHRLRHLEDNPEYITQPMAIHKESKETVAVFRESIIFITLIQNNLHMIIQDGVSLTLVGRRKSDGVESRSKFVFLYVPHNKKCLYCDINPDGSNSGEVAELAPKRLLTRPGRKRRIMSKSLEMDPEMSLDKLHKSKGKAVGVRDSSTGCVIHLPVEEVVSSEAGGSENMYSWDMSKTSESLYTKSSSYAIPLTTYTTLHRRPIPQICANKVGQACSGTRLGRDLYFQPWRNSETWLSSTARASAFSLLTSTGELSQYGWSAARFLLPLCSPEEEEVDMLTTEWKKKDGRRCMF